MIIGLYYFDGNISAAAYVDMLEEKIFDDAQAAAMAQGTPLEELWWQQDGAPAHYAKMTRNLLDATFPDQWIGRRETQEWPPRSSDLNPLDFFFWG